MGARRGIRSSGCRLRPSVRKRPSLRPSLTARRFFAG
jgi:hypothetical protein